MVCCAALEGGCMRMVDTANCGSASNDDVMVNHELLQAAKQGNLKMLRSALERGAWTETRRPLIMRQQQTHGTSRSRETEPEEEVGMTAIMFSAQSGSVECVKRLVWANALVNAVDEDGWSPLHFASKEGYLDVCLALLKARAEVALTNVDGKSAMQLAETEDPEFTHRLKNAIIDLE